MTLRLSPKQRRVLEYLNSQPEHTATLKEMRDNVPGACSSYHGGAHYFSQSIARMLKRRLIGRVKRGVYKSLTLQLPPLS